MKILNYVMETILKRKKYPKEDSYTNYLLGSGKEKILKKIGEESSEVIIASMSGERSETIYEIADLMYHTLVLMVNDGISIEDIEKELKKRYKP